MYSNINLTTYAYRAILGHLVDIEERKNEIVNELYGESAALREEFSSFLDNYLKKLEELVKTSQIVDKSACEGIKTLNYLPYVIIGSTVELISENSMDTYLFRLVSPYDNSNSKKDLSYISELGRTLLLKNQGDIIKAETNKGACSYQINSIRYEC